MMSSTMLLEAFRDLRLKREMLIRLANKDYYAEDEEKQKYIAQK